MKIVALITLVIKLFCDVSELKRHMEVENYQISANSVLSAVAPILLDVVICMGAFFVGCLMDEIMELRNMVASQKSNIAGRQYGSNVNIPNYNYQNQAYVNQNVQNTGYVESQPISSDWTCSCGCINKNGVYYCAQCGKERE